MIEYTQGFEALFGEAASNEIDKRFWGQRFQSCCQFNPLVDVHIAGEMVWLDKDGGGEM